MGSRLLGAHMPTAGGLHLAVKNGHEIGCAAIQVFTSNPQQWKARDVSEDAEAAFKKALAESDIRCVVSHDSYLVNLAAPDKALREKSIGGLRNEMRRCARYGIPFVVSHIGAHMGQGVQAGLELAASGIRSVLAEAPAEVTLLMETTAGQGSALNWRFEHLAELLEALEGDARLGVCLDTCHVFAAGYDLRTQAAYEATFAEFDRMVGLGRLKVIHANDSKKGLGSRVDRHAHIGQGELGEEAFRLLVNDARFESTPILLETPEAESMHQVNLRKLKGLQE